MCLNIEEPIETQLIIADEPTTALDVTVQQSVLQTLIKLSRQEQIAIILITHDIGVIAETCDYVYVLRYGKHVEQDTTNRVLQRPTQDYTRSLMASVPLIDKRLHRFALNEEDNLDDASIGLHYLQEKKILKLFQKIVLILIKLTKNGYML